MEWNIALVKTLVDIKFHFFIQVECQEEDKEISLNKPS
jgi:hypothetical protein